MKRVIYDRHFFSHELARSQGIEGAILLRFLTDESKRQQYLNGPRCLMTIAKIHRHLPYLSKQKIETTVAELERKGAITIGHVNTNAAPPPSSYTVLEPFAVAANRHSIRFDVDVAVKMGLAAGIVIEELRYRVTWDMKKNPQPYVTDTFRKLSSLVPYTEADLAKSLESLKAARLIIPHPTRGHRYRLPTTDFTVIAFAHRRMGTQSK